MFYVFLFFLNEPFMVTTPVGDSMVAKRVKTNCPIMLLYIVTHAELVELDMVNFYVILEMDLSHACFASIDCRTRVVNSNFLMNPS